MTNLPAALDMALTDLTEVVARLDAALLDIDVCEFEDRAHVLAVVRAQRQSLAQDEASVEAIVARDMPAKRVEVPGVGVLEKKGGALRKQWDDRRICFDATEHLSIDTDTGEVVPEVADIVTQTIDTVLDLASVAYFRAGKLRERGLDVDTYCETERGRITVQIVAAGEAESAA